jgi:hypothetical protein
MRKNVLYSGNIGKTIDEGNRLFLTVMIPLDRSWCITYRGSGEHCLRHGHGLMLDKKRAGGIVTTITSGDARSFWTGKQVRLSSLQIVLGTSRR